MRITGELSRDAVGCPDAARCARDVGQLFEPVYAPSPRRCYKLLLETINSNTSSRLELDRL
jgi:hypothetical protein